MGRRGRRCKPGPSLRATSCVAKTGARASARNRTKLPGAPQRASAVRVPVAVERRSGARGGCGVGSGGRGADEPPGSRRQWLRRARYRARRNGVIKGPKNAPKAMATSEGKPTAVSTAMRATMTMTRGIRSARFTARSYTWGQLAARVESREQRRRPARLPSFRPTSSCEREDHRVGPGDCPKSDSSRRDRAAQPNFCRAAVVVGPLSAVRHKAKTRVEVACLAVRG